MPVSNNHNNNNIGIPPPHRLELYMNSCMLSPPPRSASSQLVSSRTTPDSTTHSRQISEPFSMTSTTSPTDLLTKKEPRIQAATNSQPPRLHLNPKPPPLPQLRSQLWNRNDYKKHSFAGHRIPVRANYKPGIDVKPKGKANNLIYEAMGSMLSSDLDSTSFFDSEDEAESSRFSTTTCNTYSSSYFHKFKFQKRRKLQMPRISRASSFSSITESTVSLDVIQVVLDMAPMQFLGISIVGQPNTKSLEGGIFVGNIMKGGAVHQDGRIHSGDMILEVNGIAFDQMDNDEAVRTLREQVQRAGPIKLTVAKSWTCRESLRVPQEEPVRPIDPRAWILHTNAVREASALLDPDVVIPDPILSNSLSDSKLTLTAAAPVNNGCNTSTSSCSLPECERLNALDPHMFPADSNQNHVVLTTRTDYLTIVRSMMMLDSGLEVRDRTWLKICIPKAFIGSDLVDWLFSKVQGFSDRKEAKKFGSQLLRSGLIRHTVNKSSFSEQCYYTFADIPPIDKSSPPIPIPIPTPPSVLVPGATVLLPPPSKSFSMEKIDNKIPPRIINTSLPRRPTIPTHHPPTASVAATAGNTTALSSSGSASSGHSSDLPSYRELTAHVDMMTNGMKNSFRMGSN